MCECALPLSGSADVVRRKRIVCGYVRASDYFRFHCRLWNPRKSAQRWCRTCGLPPPRVVCLVRLPVAAAIVLHVFYVLRCVEIGNILSAFKVNATRAHSNALEVTGVMIITGVQTENSAKLKILMAYVHGQCVEVVMHFAHGQTRNKHTHTHTQNNANNFSALHCSVQRPLTLPIRAERALH